MIRWPAVLLACGIGASLAALTEPAEEEVKGAWTSEPSHWKARAGTVTLVQLSLRRATDGRRSHQSFPVPLEELKGLTAAQMDGSGPARFELVRDAGTIAFEGSFRDGVGAGHFRFTPSPEYLADIRRRGHDDLDAEGVFSLAVHDVSRRFIEELAALGYERLPLKTLRSFRVHGVTPEFARELQGLGYRGAPAEKLVKLRIHGATPEFVRELKSLGYDGLTLDELVKFRIHGVSPEFVRELKELGYSNVRPEDLVRMRIHGVSPEFIRRVRGEGRVSVDRLVQMRIHGQDR
jgi:hypothetical protein